MAVTFNQLITEWAGTTTANSGTFTPTAGDTIVVFGMNTASAHALTVTGTGTYTVPYTALENVQNPNLVGNTYCTLAVNQNATASAQHITVATTGTLLGIGLDYKSVNALNVRYSPDINTPGTGTGAIAGISTPVPSGAVLVAICIDATGSGSSAITVAGGGTSRYSGTSLAGYAVTVGEWSGTGASITPTFTCAAGGTDDFTIIQVLLAPAGAPIPVAWAPSSVEGALPLTVTFLVPCQVGDVIAIVNAGNEATSSTIVPLAITDSVNTGSYSPVGNYFDPLSTSNFYGDVSYIVCNAAGTPVVTSHAGGTNPGAGGFAGAVMIRGWAGTPTVDSAANVYGADHTGTSSTQGGNVSTSHNVEFLFASPWSDTDISASPTNWLELPTPTGLASDTTYYVTTYNNPGANNFSAPLTSAGEWLTVFGGLYDLTASPPVISSALPSGSVTGTTQTISCTTNTTSGTLYVVVDTTAHISGITAAQVIAGENNTSGAAAFSGNSTVSTTTPSKSISGLSNGTTYGYAICQVSSALDSNVLTGSFSIVNFYVQSASVHATSGTSQQVTTSFTPNAGDTLIAIARMTSYVSGYLTKVTDGYNLYTPYTFFSDGSSNGFAVLLAQNVQNQLIQPTATLSVGGLTSLVILDYQNIYSLFNGVGTFQTGNGAPTANYLTSGTVNAPLASLLIGFSLNANFSGSAPAVGTSPNAFTSRTTVWTGNALIEDAVISSSAPATAATITANETNYFFTMGLTFSTSSSGPLQPFARTVFFFNDVYSQ